MTEFNNMTIVAAVEVIAEFKSHGDMAVLEVQWGIAGNAASKVGPRCELGAVCYLAECSTGNDRKRSSSSWESRCRNGNQGIRRHPRK